MLTNVSVTKMQTVWTQIRLLELLRSGSTLFDQEALKTIQQATKADNICCDWCFKGLLYMFCESSVCDCGIS